MRIELSKGVAQRINGRFSRYDFQVGILRDATYKKPRSKKDGFNNLAGGPSRKPSRQSTDMTVGKISKILRGKSNSEFGSDYLTAPFRTPVSQDAKLIKRFLFEFIKMTSGKAPIRRVENLLQAIVRNPIARSEYGTNAPSTVVRKGFDRFMIDSGQLFRAIKAKITKIGKR